MTNKRFLLLIFLSSVVYAQQDDSQSVPVEEPDVDLKKQVKSRSGYEPDNIGYGGRASVSKQLYLDDLFIPDQLRFPEFDESIQPYYEWKRKIREKHNLQFGQDYTALYQKASDSLTDTDSVFAGVYRFYGRWLAVGKENKNSGALVFKIENSHKLGSISPDDFNKSLGYIGSTGYLYSDLEWVLNDFNWQQRFNHEKGGFVIGRIDPTDYMDVVDYANPWTTFVNENVLVNLSIAIPDTGFGAGIGYAFDDQWFIKIAAFDANGSLEDPGFFEQGAEFFSFAEIGWTPSMKVRDLKDVHVTFWHVDQRVNENVPEGDGVVLGGSWSFDKEWIVFGRTGQSRGKASLMKRSTTVGVNHIWKAYLDVFGLAVNYSEPVKESLREQTTIETFLKIKLAQNMTVTPSFQWLINPALNRQYDHIEIIGLRFRVTL
jgi:porin